MNLICPACKKEYPNGLETARHIMGTGDKKHRDWLASVGENYGDLLVHVFSEKAREYYDLERLYRHAKIMDVAEEVPA